MLLTHPLVFLLAHLFSKTGMAFSTGYYLERHAVDTLADRSDDISGGGDDYGGWDM